MISEQDLLQAIAECQAERDPDASTCKKLAAYFTIYNQMYGKQAAQKPSSISYGMPTYSFDAQHTEKPDIVSIDSGSEFARKVNGRNAAEIWHIVDDLITSLSVINPRLYRLTMRKIK